MKLFYSPGACSLSPHIALIEAGVAYEAHKVDLRSKQLADGSNYLAICPKGQVPALQMDNGEILTEGSAIVQYIADQNAEANIAPPNGSLQRYRLQEWLNFIATEVHKGFSPFWNPALPEAYKPLATEKLNKALTQVEAHLAKHKYLLGDTFSVADGYLFTCCNWAGMLNISLAAYPNLGAFMGRIAERPSVQRAMQEEGLLNKAA